MTRATGIEAGPPNELLKLQISVLFPTTYWYLRAAGKGSPLSLALTCIYVHVVLTLCVAICCKFTTKW